MDRIEPINVKRILWCCDEHGLEPGDLPVAVGISEATIKKVLEGESGLTFIQLQKIADYFERGVLFFLNPDPVDETRVLSPHCRTLANQKPDLTTPMTGWVRKVERQREVYLSLREEMDVPVPKVDFPRVDRRDPAKAAAQVREWLGLEDRGDFDSFRSAIEAKNILVFRSNGYAGDWQIPKDSPVIGFSLYFDLCPVIVVKKQRWETRQSFTLMHELAHLILHRTSMLDEESDLHSHARVESEANLFAGHMLVPERFLDLIPLREKPEHVAGYDEWLKSCRNRWGASTECILWRMSEAGLLPKGDVEAYRRLDRPLPEDGKGNRKYRHREPRNIFGDGFVKTVLDAYNSRRIPATRASRYLDKLKLSDLHKLEGYYAGV